MPRLPSAFVTAGFSPPAAAALLRYLRHYCRFVTMMPPIQMLARVAWLSRLRRAAALMLHYLPLMPSCHALPRFRRQRELRRHHVTDAMRHDVTLLDGHAFTARGYLYVTMLPRDAARRCCCALALWIRER